MNEKNIFIMVCSYVFLGLIIAILTGAIIYNNQQATDGNGSDIPGGQELNSRFGEQNTELEAANRRIEELESEFSEYRKESEREISQLRNNLTEDANRIDRIESIGIEIQEITDGIRDPVERLGKIIEAIKAQKVD